MSQLFADGLGQRIALAAQFLGWTPDIFWSATPQECGSALSDWQLDQTTDPATALTRSDLQQLLESDCDG